MPKFKHYTAKLVERQIKAIIRRNPNTINPTDSSGCLYHQGSGSHIRRCLIGQWGFEQGFRTPRAINGGADEVVGEHWSKQALFDDRAVNLMNKFQRLADGVSVDGDIDPVPWKELL